MKQTKSALFLIGVLLTVIILSVVFGAKKKKSYEFFGRVGSPSRPNSLMSDNESANKMNAEDILVSSDGEYTLKMEPTGDLSIHNSAGTLIWNINIYGKFNPVGKLNSDGSFALYDRGDFSKPPYWTTGTNGGNAPFRLTMQKDGNLTIYGRYGKPRWASRTARAVKNNTSCTQDQC